MPSGLTEFQLFIAVCGTVTGVLLSLSGMWLGPLPILLACGVYWFTTQYVINNAVKNFQSTTEHENVQKNVN